MKKILLLIIIILFAQLVVGDCEYKQMVGEDTSCADETTVVDILNKEQENAEQLQTDMVKDLGIDPAIADTTANNKLKEALKFHDPESKLGLDVIGTKFVAVDELIISTPVEKEPELVQQPPKEIEVTYEKPLVGRQKVQISEDIVVELPSGEFKGPLGMSLKDAEKKHTQTIGDQEFEVVRVEGEKYEVFKVDGETKVKTASFEIKEEDKAGLLDKILGPITGKDKKKIKITTYPEAKAPEEPYVPEVEPKGTHKSMDGKKLLNEKNEVVILAASEEELQKSIVQMNNAKNLKELIATENKPATVEKFEVEKFTKEEILSDVYEKKLVSTDENGKEKVEGYVDKNGIITKDDKIIGIQKLDGKITTFNGEIDNDAMNTIQSTEETKLYTSKATNEQIAVVEGEVYLQTDKGWEKIKLTEEELKSGFYESRNADYIKKTTSEYSKQRKHDENVKEATAFLSNQINSYISQAFGYAASELTKTMCVTD